MSVLVDTSVLVDVPGHRGIDSADLAIAATVVLLDARLLTCNVKHFPMFTGLSRPY